MELTNFFEYIVRTYLIDNTLFAGLSVFLGVFSAIADIIAFYRPDRKGRFYVKAFIATVLIAMLCYYMSFEIAMTVYFIFVVVSITVDTTQRHYTQVRVEFSNDKNGQILEDMQEDMELGRDYEMTMSNRFINIERSIKENRPKEAVELLKKCAPRVQNQVRYSTYYADALMMQRNYAGALSKLNAIPSEKLKKKRVLKSVMCRKAMCYKGMDKYVDEMKCYDKLIKSNYKKEKYYYYRGVIKTRIVEVCPYIDSVRKEIESSYGSVNKLLTSAQTDFNRALKFSNKYEAKILSYQGACCFLLDQEEKGLKFFQNSLELDDTFENTYVYIGIYNYSHQNPESAAYYLEKAIECDANDEKVYYYLALISRDKRDYKTAIRYAAKALSCFKYRDDCYALQGDCYKRQCMYNEAIECYTKALELRKKASYYEARSNCYYNKPNRNAEMAYRDAAACYELEQTEYNYFDKIHKEIVWNISNHKKYSEKELDYIVAPYTDKKRYYMTIGNIYYNGGYMEKAREYYQKELGENPGNMSSSYNLALTYKKENNFTKAAEILEKLIEKGTNDPKFYDALLGCYKSLENEGGEIKVQVKLSAARKRKSDTLKKNGDSVYELNNYYEAYDYYKSALDYAGNSAALLNNLACALHGIYKYDEALVYFEKSKSVDRTYYLAYYNCGNCLLSMDDTLEARKRAESNYREALQLKPSFQEAEKMLRIMDRSHIKMIIDKQ